MKNIVLITDCTDVATEQIKARIARILKEKNIDFKIYLAFTPPFQITNGMFLSKLLCEEMPDGEETLYLAILNPLKEKPKRIFGKLDNNSWFVGADTGIFSLLFQEKGISELWETKNHCHYPFGGLHIHAVAAANLLCGQDKKLVGDPLNIQTANIYSPKEGEVVHIDNFGLSKIWLRHSDLNFEENTPVIVRIYDSNKNLKNEVKGFYSNRMMNYEDNSLIVYPGSSLLELKLKGDNEKYRKSGLIEIGLVRNPESSKTLKIQLGDIIKIMGNN